MFKKSFFCRVGALISAAIVYCSCTAGISVGKANRVEQTVTNIADSTSATFSILPNNNNK